ncbi:MAG: hypothetical protein KGL39_17920 [Patescibacteria group bacterium]|nr:hypothetical protein [Patescibacteria group bacterium]
MLGLFAFIATIAGAFLRRFWGGWEQESVPEVHFIKMAIVLALNMLVGIFVFLKPELGMIYGFILLAVFLNPFHAEGQRMGFAKSSPSLSRSVLIMSGSYGAFTSLAAIVFAYMTHASWPMFYAPMGFLASAGYLLGWYVLPPLFGGLDANNGYVKKVKLGSAYLIDGPAASGELVLGALLVGGIPVAKALFGAG